MVLGPVLESLPQGVSIRPAHLWLLEAPSPCVRERDWWVLALRALSAMSRFRRQFVQGRVAQVWEATTSFFMSWFIPIDHTNYCAKIMSNLRRDSVRGGAAP